jgi:hypothetical protein
MSDAILERILDKVEAGTPLVEAEIAVVRLARGIGRINYVDRSQMVTAGRDIRENIIVSGSSNIIIGKVEWEAFQANLAVFSMRHLTEAKKVGRVLVTFCLAAIFLWLPSAFRHTELLPSIYEYFVSLLLLLLHPVKFFEGILSNNTSSSDASAALSVFLATISIQHAAKLLLSVAPHAVSDVRKSLLWGTLALLIVISAQAEILTGLTTLGMDLGFASAFSFEAYFWSIIVLILSVHLFISVRILRTALPHIAFADMLKAEAEDDSVRVAEIKADAPRAGEDLMNRIGAFSAAHAGLTVAAVSYYLLLWLPLVLYVSASAAALASFFSPSAPFGAVLAFALFQTLSLVPETGARLLFGLRGNLQW